MAHCAKIVLYPGSSDWRVQKHHLTSFYARIEISVQLQL